jgi:DNA polymerase V
MESDTENLAGGDGVSVHTGFPNPALDRRGQQALALDINQLLVKRPSSTYLFQVAGHSYASSGIFDGDVAVIDRALPPRDSDLVIAWQDSGFVICRKRQLSPDSQPWGVVTATIHQFERD